MLPGGYQGNHSTGNNGGLVGVPTRDDVARSMQRRTYDQYGRPVKSVDELCAEARAAGGPVTKICAINQWSK